MPEFRGKLTRRNGATISPVEGELYKLPPDGPVVYGGVVEVPVEHFKNPAKLAIEEGMILDIDGGPMFEITVVRSSLSHDKRFHLTLFSSNGAPLRM